MFVEAALIGLVGAVAGVLGGLLFAKGIESLFDALGIGLPTTALVVATRTVIVSVVIGIAVTSDRRSQPGPALDPGAADRGDAEPRPHSQPPPLDGHSDHRLGSDARRAGPGPDRAVRRTRRPADAALLLGGGAAVVLFGVSLYSPRLVRPLAGSSGHRSRGCAGSPAGWRARTRSGIPSRTAATAAALMIGLALVSFVTVFAAGLKASIAAAIDNSFQGELGDPEHQRLLDPIPKAIAATVRQVPGVQTVSTLQATQIKIDGVGASHGPRASTRPPLLTVLKLDFQGDTSEQTLRNLTDYADDHRQDASPTPTGSKWGTRFRRWARPGTGRASGSSARSRTTPTCSAASVVTQGAMAGTSPSPRTPSTS